MNKNREPVRRGGYTKKELLKVIETIDSVQDFTPPKSNHSIKENQKIRLSTEFNQR